MGNFLPISRKGIRGTCQQASHWTAPTSQSVLYLPLGASQQGLFCLNEGADTSSVSLCLWNSNIGQFLWENWVSFCFASSSPKAKLGFHFPSFSLNEDQKELESRLFLWSFQDHPSQSSGIAQRPRPPGHCKTIPWCSQHWALYCPCSSFKQKCPKLSFLTLALFPKN